MGVLRIYCSLAIAEGVGPSLRKSIRRRLTGEGVGVRGRGAVERADASLIPDACGKSR